MKFFKKYIVDSQLYVSLMATMLTSFFLVEQVSFRWPLIIIIFLTYINGYLYTKYQQVKKKIFYILIINAITFCICSVFIIINHHAEVFLRWMVIIVLGLLYDNSFLSTWIRKLPFVKIFYVGLVWGLTNAWLITETFQWEVFLMTLFFVSALIIPFDIRDMNYDTVITFPIAFGINNSKIIAYVLSLIALGFAYFAVTETLFYAFAITIAITFIFIYFSQPYRPDLYYSFGIESLSGLPLVLYFILNL
ncbi:hypothetical protein [Elizabethkingia sp. JS20170427COW]|uniref:hypothetical protein n=1 Tax=Elizabethkingia sp. JS20170427COW TaxID=2583851 RepID=UPI0021036C74|nr:hypothetical protein [Elizabethkingia sp. JS20170427COW]